MSNKRDWLGNFIRELEAQTPGQNTHSTAELNTLSEPPVKRSRLDNVAEPPLAVAGPSSALEQIPFPNPPVPQLVQPTAEELDLPIDNMWYSKRFCPWCLVNFARSGDLDRHYWDVHPEYFNQVQQGGGVEGQQVQFNQSESAIEDMFVIYKANLAALQQFKDVDELFHSAEESGADILAQELEHRKNLRVIFTITTVFSRTNPVTGETEYTDDENIPYMRSFDHIIMNRSMIPRIWNSAMNKIAVEVEDFIRNGSAWVIDHIKEFQIKIATYAPITAASYMELPPLLQRKKYSLLNIQNDEENDDQDHLKCFVWSILAHPSYGGLPQGLKFNNLRKKLSKKVSTYKPHLNRLNLDGLNFPMTLEQIPKFEKQNPEIGLTVIIYEIGENNEIEEEEEEEEADPRQLVRRKNSKYNLMQEQIRDRCYPGYVCSEDRPIKVDLLLLVADTIECNERPDHFVFIKNLISLLHTNNNSDTKAICRNCLQTFRKKETMDVHKKYCPSLRLQKTIFPQEHNKVYKFTNWNRTQRVPFVIYADLECFLPVILKEQFGKTTKLQEHIPCGFAIIVVDHEGNRYEYARYRAKGNSEEIAKTFLNRIIKICEKLKKKMGEYQYEAQRIMLTDNSIEYDNGHCCFCKEAFPHIFEDNPNILEKNKQVRHHEHLPPYKFVGYAHNACNLNARMTESIPVVLHNFSNYDGHFVVQACNKEIVKKLEFVARTSEKFMATFVNRHIRFIDSYAFFPKSLAKLADGLPKGDPKSFKVTHQMFGNEDSATNQSAYGDYLRRQDPNLQQITSDLNNCADLHQVMEISAKMIDHTFQSHRPHEATVFLSQLDSKYRIAYPGGDVELLLQKQAYPYSYMTSIDKFDERSLPPPEAFYNDLTGTDIKADDYKHLQKVWKSFDLQCLGDLHDLYVALDVSLLADVFESNRRTMYEHYGLDIAHYLSLPMVSKDALLLKTKAKLDLLTDPTMYCWLEGGIRGGLVSVGSLRSAEANNKYMENQYDPSKPTSFITFLDANNQYGWALSEPLPEKDFVWVEGNELTNILKHRETFINNLGIEDQKGYIFEVDLDVPSSTHDYLNDYPPAPVKRLVQREELSQYQQNRMQKENTPASVLKTERLIADLRPKKNMVCHYRNLQMWLRLGCTVGRIHRVLKFTQRRWMKPYIEYNTQMRQQAASDIEIDFWKLLNNCGFGKMIERLRERLNVIAIMTETRGRRYCKKPTMQDFKIIHSGLVLLMMKKLTVTLNNPIAVGFACLELSKLVMYQFHYDYMKPKFGNIARVLYSDTDSFAYFIEYLHKNGDIYEDFKQDEQNFDMSDYEESHPVWGRFHSLRNKKVLGRFKDEMSNAVITCMVVAKPKMYIVRYVKDRVNKTSGCMVREVEEKKKAKGLGMTAVQNCLSMEHYTNALEGILNEDISMKSIRSFKHNLYTIDMKKKSISGIEVKRFCLDDGVNTLAFGHMDIPKYYE